MSISTEKQIFLKLMANAAFSELMKFCNNVPFDQKPIVDLALTLQENFLKEGPGMRRERRPAQGSHLCAGKDCKTTISKTRWDSGQHFCYYCHDLKKRLEKDAQQPKCRICRRNMKVIHGKQLTQFETCCFCRQDLRAKGKPLRMVG
jgi:hypothetical protein